MELLGEEVAHAREGKPVQLSPALARLAGKERYLAMEVQGLRYNIGVRYGLLQAQLALALDGQDREEVLAQIVEQLAARDRGDAGADENRNDPPPAATNQTVPASHSTHGSRLELIQSPIYARRMPRSGIAPSTCSPARHRWNNCSAECASSSTAFGATATILTIKRVRALLFFFTRSIAFIFR